MILVAWSSDRKLERRYHAAIPILLGGVALLFMNTAHSPFVLLALLSVLAGVYSYPAPFMSIPSEFLSGFSAAAGLALINSIGNLSGFAGPYLIGVVGSRTGNLYRGFALAGIPLIVSAVLLMLLPKKANISESKQVF
jgi:ACS family tartrate transporter-like MFS transporter